MKEEDVRVKHLFSALKEFNSQSEGKHLSITLHLKIGLSNVTIKTYLMLGVYWFMVTFPLNSICGSLIRQMIRYARGCSVDCSITALLCLMEKVHGVQKEHMSVVSSLARQAVRDGWSTG